MLLTSIIMGQKSSLLDLHNGYQIVMIGLDNAGKSTILYRLKIGQYIDTAPTIGFNCEKIKSLNGKSKGSTFNIWDVGGQEKIRPLWRSYVRHTDAVIFVVDSNDEERFEEAKLEFSNLLRCPDIPVTVPILLVANKQDLPSSKKDKEVETKIGMADICSNHPTVTLPCCAVTGEGLDDALDSLYDLIQQSKKIDKINKRKASH